MTRADTIAALKAYNPEPLRLSFPTQAIVSMDALESAIRILNVDEMRENTRQEGVREVMTRLAEGVLVGERRQDNPRHSWR